MSSFPEKKSVPSLWAPLLGLFAVLLVATVDSQLLIPLLPSVSRDLSTELSTLGRLFSIYAGTATLTNIVLGPLTDRLGRQPFVYAGLLLLVLSSLAVQWSQTFLQLAMLRAVAGISGGLLSLCTASLIGDWFPYRRRGRAMGVLLSAYFAALIFGIPLSVAIAERWQWRTGFLGIALFAGASLVVVLLVFPSRVRPRQTGIDLGETLALLKPGKGIAGALIVSFLASGATLSFLTYISGLGLSAQQIGSLFMVTGMASIAGAPMAGWVSDRLSKRLVFLLANSLLLLPLALVVSVPWGAGLFFVFFALMLLVASRQTALQAVQTELVTASSRGALLGLRNGFSQAGIASCVLLASFLFEKGGFEAVVGLAAALSLAASLVFWLFVPEPQPRRGASQR